MIGPQSRLTEVVGKSAEPLTKARGIRTVEDLLNFWPRRYISPGTNLAGLHNGMYAVVVADVRTAVKRPMKARKGSILNVTVTDGTNDLDIAFFKAYGHEASWYRGHVRSSPGRSPTSTASRSWPTRTTRSSRATPGSPSAG